ncbi:sodium:solute symporter family protein [Desulfovibrio porci]|uniref:sodium:solute symporter family protein n=1 Tax=Desulfovibrio porci TaxID=2605782 RepID=UPI002A82360F|nr:sodium:solute symporter family protein [Desulfovibrio porci]MDY3809176.1 sodium:solute symporter family protein [Desulfovibrio porci]
MGWYLGYIIVYFLIMFGIGFYYFLKVKSADDYLIGGWSMGFWPIVGTVISTWCGASVFIGTVGLGFQVGASGYIRFSLASVIFTLILILAFGRALRRQRLYTLADLFGQRFGVRVGIIPSLLSAVVYSIPTTAMQYLAMSTIWSACFGMEIHAALILSALLVLAFTVLGGLPGTIVTDALQAVLIVAGIIILAVAAVSLAGGMGPMLAATPPEFLSPSGPYGAKEVAMFFISVGPFYLVWQSSWQRIFAAKSEKVSLNANTLGVLICCGVFVCPILIGLSARQFLPADINPDLIFSTVTRDLLPPYVGGLIYCALLAALVTGADSFILQGSSNLTHDFYRQLINPKADNKRLMLVSRLTVALVALAALWVAFNFTGIIAIYQWALRLTATTIVLPFLATMLWRRLTRAGVLAGMLGGLISTLVWPYLGISFDQTLFGFIFSALGVFGVSLVTRHHPEEHVAAVLWEDLPTATQR